jgi:hypothetical protein
VEKLFGIELENTVKNTEDPDEPPQVNKEHVLRLSCHIDNNNNPINHLIEGLKISLSGSIEKHSDKLGRNAIYFKEAKINKLVRVDLSLTITAIILNNPIRKILLEERKHSIRNQSRQSKDS